MTQQFHLHDFETPDGLRYHAEHLWVKLDGGVAIVGWTDFSQKTAGDVAFIDLPKVGGQVQKEGTVGTLETGKWVGKLPSPVAGTIVAVNEQLRKEPGLINKEPYGKGWIVKIRPNDTAAVGGLLDKAGYVKVMEKALKDMH